MTIALFLVLLLSSVGNFTFAQGPTVSSGAAFAASTFEAATSSQVEVSWEKVACPFDASKALLPVTCGRLRVPENYDDPKGRSYRDCIHGG